MPLVRNQSAFNTDLAFSSDPGSDSIIVLTNGNHYSLVFNDTSAYVI